MTRCNACKGPDAAPIVRGRSETHPLCANCSAELGLFAQIGIALFGTLWQRPIAELIGSNERTIRAWWHGDRSIPVKVRDIEVWPHLAKALADRSDQMPELLAQAMEKAGAVVEAAP